MKNYKFILTSIAAALAAGFGPFGPVADAADADRIAQLESQLKVMQEQINALKNSTASADDVADLKGQVAAQGKEAVVVGDIPNSFRLSGSDTSIHIYGTAELDLVHESKGDNSGSDYSTFAPYLPLDGSTLSKRTGQTYLHARASRIGLEGSTPSPYGLVMVKIEGDFNNEPRTGNSATYGSLGNIYTQQSINSYNFRLRHAYVQAGPWLFGQTWSTFMDVDNSPETVDFNGPIGSTFIRQPLIRYTYATPQYGNFIVAAENSVSYVLDASGVATTDGFSKVPDLVLRWDKSFDWGSLSLRGVSHEHRINGALGNQTKRGSGLAASGLIKSVGSDFFSWAITGGNGIGRYFNYVEGAAYNAVSNQIEMERVLGVVVGYQHKYSSTFRINLVYGAQKNFTNGYTDLALANGFGGGQFGINRRVSQFHIGGIWNPIKVMDVGLEYIYGQRETLLGEKGDMSRLNFMVRYNFN